MRTSIIAVMLLVSTTLASLPQELSVEDRACITSAVAKLRALTGPRTAQEAVQLNIEGSRVIESRVLEQPQSQGRRNPNLWPAYRVKLEIDASVAGQRSTYILNCTRTGQAILIQPLGMR
jgi:hypothetical protein